MESLKIIFAEISIVNKHVLRRIKTFPCLLSVYFSNSVVVISLWVFGMIFQTVGIEKRLDLPS